MVEGSRASCIIDIDSHLKQVDRLLESYNIGSFPPDPMLPQRHSIAMLIASQSLKLVLSTCQQKENDHLAMIDLTLLMSRFSRDNAGHKPSEG